VHKSLNYQGICEAPVSIVTEHRRSRDGGTRAARCAFAMMNVSNMLLLDEEDLMREATALLLANRGAHVTKTATIDDALAQLERRTYDVVIVDVHQSWQNPAQLIQRIINKTSARIIVCSEKPLPNLDPSGITHLLVKPYPFDRLVEAAFVSRPSVARLARPVVKPLARRVTTPRRSAPLVRRGRA
jgi:CheY-like chemotaxis protein